MTSIRECMFGDDMLILDKQKGFSGYENKELFVVYYCERYDEDFGEGIVVSYNVHNSEYFEILEDAHKAFDSRELNDPIRPSAIEGFTFPYESLGDILKNAQKPRD